MKKHLFFAGLIVIALGIGCASKDTNSDDYSMMTKDSSIVTTDSAMMAKDSSLMAKDSTETMRMHVDTPATKMTTSYSSAEKMHKAMPDPAKKGKKGKVSIVMDNRVSANMSVDKEGYYNTTEILPGYPGGEKALGQFYDNNIQYPIDASDNGIDGTVKINFAVDENGKLYSPVVTSPIIGYGLEQEALRVFNKMPKWTPGRIKGKNVKTRFSLPVKFQLQ